jgi:hypothetical protein
MKDYEEDEIGELEHDDPALHGKVPTNNEAVSKILDEFLVSQQATTSVFGDNDIKPTDVETPSHLATIRAVKSMASNQQLREEVEYVEVEVGEEEEKWDCESIISRSIPMT